MTIAERYQETIPLPRAIRFPVELVPPEGFDPEDPRTWPRVDGRLEYVNERLLYRPPCGDMQQHTVADVVTTLNIWARRHAGFVVGTNEAGVLLKGAARAADAAIWRQRWRYGTVDRQGRADTLGVELRLLAEAHREWVEMALRSAELQRQA